MAIPRPRTGFTLIELLIALAVVALLSAMAYPSYTSHIAKGRRADAKQATLDLAQRMERFYTERGTYAGAALGGAGIYPALSPAGYYSMAIVSQSADGFSITASPLGRQLGDACGTYACNQLGEQTVNDATLSAIRCW